MSSPIPTYGTTLNLNMVTALILSGVLHGVLLGHLNQWIPEKQAKKTFSVTVITRSNPETSQSNPIQIKPPQAKPDQPKATAKPDQTKATAKPDQTKATAKPNQTKASNDDHRLKHHVTHLGALPQTPLGRNKSLPRPIPTTFDRNNTQEQRKPSILQQQSHKKTPKPPTPTPNKKPLSTIQPQVQPTIATSPTKNPQPTPITLFSPTHSPTPSLRPPNPTTNEEMLRIRIAIKKSLNNHFRYPAQARRREWQGRVVLNFRLKKEGSLIDIRVKTSSGYQILDQSALQTLHTISPLTLIKPLSFTDPLEMQIPIVFRLNENK